MKHVEAGLIIGGLWLAASIVAAIAWAVINWATGPEAATVAIAIAVIVFALVIVVDWATERRGS